METYKAKKQNDRIKTIYYYTNWKAFEGFFAKKKMRLSNISYSNDANEFIFGLDRLNLRKWLKICKINGLDLYQKEKVKRLDRKYN